MSASATVIIDYVSVGNAGNAADSTGHGAVAYEYKIGKYEVTNAQYAEFLNAKAGADGHGLYNTGMASYGITRSGSSGNFSYAVTAGLENRPVVYVFWHDAARFTNWLANGQGSGDTESGSYTLNGVTYETITANVAAAVYIPSEDEWYKAAYYNGTTSTYSLYPNGQDTISTADANFVGDDILVHSTDVGSYSGDWSAYGTFDQGGNVWEWNDTVADSMYLLRGGSWLDNDSFLISSSSYGTSPSLEFYTVGFRVASVPEPGVWTLLTFASGSMLVRRRR